MSGFSLVVALVLMAFMVSLILSVSTLATLNTIGSRSAVEKAEARESARYALLSAMGQLQRYAGPDQRVTARADINTANTGNPHWIGVWSSEPSDTNLPSHADAPASDDPLVWLVSGADTGLTPDQDAVADPADDNTNCWLLKSVAGVDLDVEDRIKLKTTSIADEGTVTGRFAYWIDDLGLKASLAVTSELGAVEAGSAEQVEELTVAPEFGGDLLTGLGEVYQKNITDGSDSEAEDFRQTLCHLAGYGDLHFLGDDVSSADIANLYYDVTVSTSYGVLADSLRGGLRRDLTRGLDDSLSFNSEPSQSEIGSGVAVDFGNRDDDGNVILPDPGPVGQISPNNSLTYTNGEEPDTPTWDLVRSFANTRSSDSGSMSPQAAPFGTFNQWNAIPSWTQTVMPVVVMVDFRFGLDVTGTNYRYVVQPTVVLCNPYNVSLNSASYVVTFKPSDSDDPEMVFYVKDSGVTVASFSTFSFANQMGNQELAFNITDSFAPGEVKIYQLSADMTYGSSDVGVVDMQNGYTAANLLIDTGVAVDPTLTDPSSSAYVELNSADVDYPMLSIALGSATKGATGASVPTPTQVARYIEVEDKRMDIGYDKDNPSNKQSKPKAYMAADAATGTVPTASQTLISFRFSLTTPTNDYLTSGNQPGSTNHSVPSDHTAYRSSDGGTVSDSTSGMRSLIDANPRAQIGQRLGGWDDVPTYHFDSYRDSDYSLDTSGSNGFWGGSLDDDGNGTSEVVLFDVLRPDEELVSLGQLGMVNWGIGAKHPSYPLGNSYASIFYYSDGPDFSFALNEALWDRFFFSTLPNEDLDVRPDELANSRLAYYGADEDLSELEGINGYEKAAAHLMVKGAFNVNSTSVEAWAAFLGSIPRTDYEHDEPSGATDSDDSVRPYLRLRHVHNADPRDEIGSLYEWSGYRELSDDEITSIAEKIVEGIQNRGRPARSLAEFLNRDLNEASTSIRNQKGIVQAAIDEVVNQDDPTVAGDGQDALDDLPGIVGAYSLSDALVVENTLVNADNPDAAAGKLRATGAPGFVMQNDIITPLAPAMSARSDTFLIRAYGDSRNPMTGELQAKAWCEAVVQRIPDYVGGEAAETSPDNLTAGSKSDTFGRRFVVTSFRWLTSDEI